jgi:hypothetical protein
VRWPQVLVACAAVAACHSFTPTTGPATDAGSANDGASTADASSTGAIRCPSSPPQRCALGTSVCCATVVPLVPVSYACVDAQHCNGEYAVSIPCGRADDCAAGGFPGAVCCMFRDPTGDIDRFECVAPVACPAPGRVCDPLAPECGADCVPDPEGFHPELYFCTR